MPGRTVVVRSSGPSVHHHQGQGVTCCCGCVRCCACINWGYLVSRPGIMKIAEFILASMCQSLSIRFGLPYATDMGSAFEGFLAACSACLIGSFCLLVCFVVSEKSVGLVRSSLFETIHNGVCAALVLSSSSSLMAAVNLYLWPRYLITPFYQVFPAMTAAAFLGVILGILFAFDCYLSYRYYKGYR
ncbi:hypothetical protein B566_EDAN002750 [Ephemera danica]|nr:hypothetical protein B566_EDAN002750 [Ephemera danica]